MDEHYNCICENLAILKEAFRKTIENYFKSYIKSGKEQGNFDWKQLQIFYNSRKKELSNIYCLRMFCEFALKMFITFNCPNENFVIKIVRMHQTVVSEYAELDFCSYCTRNYLPRHYRYEEVISSRFILRAINQLATDTFKYTNRDYYARMAVGAIIVGDYTFMEFLVKYGLSYPLDDVFEQARNHFVALFSNFVCLNPHAGNDVLHEREQFADSVLTRLFRNNKNPNLRRISLIIMAVDFTLGKWLNDSCYMDFVNCLNLYASTLPEAEISMKDVEDFLCFTFPNEKDFIDETCTRFKEVFPNTPSFKSPRSLKYLCRFKIRDCIQKSPSLMTVLSKLCMPTPLKDYLCYMTG